MNTISEKELDSALSSVLSEGDDVLIHASLKPLGYFENGIEDLCQSICNRVTPRGTVIMMADTRSFAKTGTFNLNQPSETGLITECFRKMDGVLRSCVPMVSFCAWGARAQEYTQPYHSHLDDSATINRLLANDGKIMLYGIGYEKCTLFHLAEERHKSPYNFYKEFKGVLKQDGVADKPISQKYFVRKDMSVKKDPSIVGEQLEKEKLVQMARLGSGVVRVFQARDFDNFCMQSLENDPEAFIVK